MEINNKGTFRPKLFVMKPKKMLHINAPTEYNDVTQDASSIVIFPVGNGESSDVSNIIFELVHPSSIPNTMVKRFTTKKKNKITSLVCFKLLIQISLEVYLQMQ